MAILRSELIKIMQEQINEIGDGEVYIHSYDSFGDRTMDPIEKEYISLDKEKDTVIDLTS